MPSRWLKDVRAKKYEEHRKRIRNMQPQVDTSEPHQLPCSGKREIERRRAHAAIERDNRELLTRLGKAMQLKNIDNESKVTKGVSLQAVKRRIELERITDDNLRLLDRLQKTIPAYDHHAWEKEAESRDKILLNMTEFPELYKPRYTLPKKLTNMAKSASTSPKIGMTKQQNIKMNTNNVDQNNATTSNAEVDETRFGEILPPIEQPPLGLVRPSVSD